MSTVQGSEPRVTRRRGKAVAPKLLPGSAVIDPAPQVLGDGPTPVGDDESFELDTSLVDETPRDAGGREIIKPNPNMPAWSNPGPLAAEQPKQVIKLGERDYSGQYRALARLNLDGGSKVVPPNSIVTLTDEEARHFLASGVIRVPGDVGENGARDLESAEQDFAGPYTALARLNLESGERVNAGSRVMLDDAEARHFLKTGSVKSADGYRL